jgi:hypothetical protein
MKSALNKVSVFKNINLENAVAQTLARRFKSEIPTITPDCYVDLLKRDVNGKESNFLIFSKTNKVEATEVNELASALVRQGVKTLGILDPHCQFKMFVNESPEGLGNDIRVYSQNYLTSNNYGNTNINIDSFLFEGTEKKYYGYTNFSMPHAKKQIELCFEPFLKSGGAIVSVQDRYAPISRFALETPQTATDIDLSTLFCELSDRELHIWTAINYGVGVFSPLVAEFSNKLSSVSSVDFLIDSIIGQTMKQYHFWAPSLAVFIDVRSQNEDRNEIDGDEIKKSLANSSGRVIELGNEEGAINASLYGALLLASDSKKKRDENENQTQRKIPRVNITSVEWTHNYLIPIALKEFYRKGVSFIACLLFLIFLCWGGYWFTGNLRAVYEGDIKAFQNNTAKNLRDFANLKERSEEFSQLGSWRPFPDLSTQYSALSSFFVRNNCLLVRAVFHSRGQDLVPKLLEDIKPEFERLTRSAINAIDMSGVWDIAFRLPISGVSTAETRKNIITALQKDAAAAFSTGPKDTTSPKSLLIFNEEQGQNTMNMLRNENGMNAVFLVWKNPNSTGRR